MCTSLITRFHCNSPEIRVYHRKLPILVASMSLQQWNSHRLIQLLNDSPRRVHIRSGAADRKASLGRIKPEPISRITRDKHCKTTVIPTHVALHDVPSVMNIAVTPINNVFKQYS